MLGNLPQLVRSVNDCVRKGGIAVGGRVFQRLRNFCGLVRKLLYRLNLIIKRDHECTVVFRAQDLLDEG